jgi:AraC-like DNA-binding protein
MNELAARCRAYETVARAIRFVRQRSPCQPSLQEIAAHVGMSHFHLQRLFSVWVGISPKRFLQYLTTEHARSLLRGEYDVLSAAHAAGLSGPGRLHDLMVACDAATPGEVRSLGEGLLITYGFGPTPFGRVIAGTTARGLCHLQFVNANDSTDDAIASFARMVTSAISWGGDRKQTASQAARKDPRREKWRYGSSWQTVPPTSKPALGRFLCLL